MNIKIERGQELQIKMREDKHLEILRSNFWILRLKVNRTVQAEKGYLSRQKKKKKLGTTNISVTLDGKSHRAKSTKF